MEKIEQLKKLCVHIGIITVEECNKCMSTTQLLYLMIDKINKLIESVETLDRKVKEEVFALIREMMEDGTLEQFIDEVVLTNLNNRINECEKDIPNLLNEVGDWYSPKYIRGTELGTNGVPSSYSPENMEKFYDWVLNPLMKQHPDYISRQTLGKDSSCTFPIYRYVFEPKNYDRTIIMISSAHGNEYTSFFGLCRLLEEVCNNYQSDSNLYYLRHKVKMVVIPVVNPWGFVNKNRRNVNGVDLNRNTDYRWNEYTSVNGQIGGKYYKGSKPFSEKESQYVKQTVEEFKDDNLVAFMDLHTINTIEAEKVLYYPRFSQNLHQEFSYLVKRFDSETGNNRDILSSSTVPSFTNWVCHTYKLSGCNPEFSNSAYGTTRGEFLMRKHVEWVGNIALTLVKANRRINVSYNQPHLELLMWDKDTSLPDTEDDDRNSNKGHRILKSEILTTMEQSVYYTKVISESLIKMDGFVKVKAELDCEVFIDPFLYQQHSPEQNFNLLQDVNRWEQSITLKQGQEAFIPIHGVIQGFHENYNDENSSRSALVGFRLRARTTVANSVWITGYRVSLTTIPSNNGLPVRIKKQVKDGEVIVFPTRIEGEIDD